MYTYAAISDAMRSARAPEPPPSSSFSTIKRMYVSIYLCIMYACSSPKDWVMSASSRLGGGRKRHKRGKKNDT